MADNERSDYFFARQVSDATGGHRVQWQAVVHDPCSSGRSRRTTEGWWRRGNVWIPLPRNNKDRRYYNYILSWWFGFSDLFSLFALLVYTYYCTLVCGLIGLRKDQPATMSVSRHLLRRSYGRHGDAAAPRRDAHSQNSRFSSTRVKSH